MSFEATSKPIVSGTDRDLLLIHRMPTYDSVLRYGSWGEPCACILWYREERRRKTRDIYRRHRPLQEHRVSNL